MNPYPYRGQRILGLLSLVVLSTGCSAQAGGEASESNFTQHRSAIERKLDVELELPSNTPIGRTMDAVQAELAQGLTVIPTSEAQAAADARLGCRFLAYGNARGEEVFHRHTCELSDVISVGYRAPNDIDQVYGDHGTADRPKDTLIDSFSQKSGAYDSVEDSNRDGKVDGQIFVATDADEDLSAFGGWKLGEGASLAKRVLRDNDFSGKFETLSLTAKDGWFDLER